MWLVINSGGQAWGGYAETCLQYVTSHFRKKKKKKNKSFREKEKNK